MRACWAATILVLVQPSPAFGATCRGTSVVPRVLVPTHRHLRKSPCVRQPFVEISGSIAFSSLWFLSRKLCPIFVCQFKGSLHIGVQNRPFDRFVPRIRSSAELIAMNSRLPDQDNLQERLKTVQEECRRLREENAHLRAM